MIVPPVIETADDACVEILPRPKAVLAVDSVVAPVPPLLIETIPDTLVALPVTVPVRLPVTYIRPPQR